MEKSSLESSLTSTERRLQLLKDGGTAVGEPVSFSTMKLSQRQAVILGGKKSAKIIGIIFLAVLPFGIIEPFLFMIWGGLLLLFLIVVVGPLLHVHFAGDRETFKFVDAPCPNCGAVNPLTPYLHERVRPLITLLCPSCGQTCKGRVLE